MIIDQSLVLLDATVAAGSNGTGQFPTTSNAALPGNIIDLRATANDVLASGSGLDGIISYGSGTLPIYVVIAVPTAFTGGTSVDFQIRTSNSLSSGALASPTVLYDTGAIAEASLTAGAIVFAGILPVIGVQQYIDVNLTGVGTFSAGAVNAFLTDNVQSLNVPLYPINAAV